MACTSMAMVMPSAEAQAEVNYIKAKTYAPSA